MSTLKNLPPVLQQQSQQESDAYLVSNDQNDLEYRSSLNGTIDYAKVDSITKFNGPLTKNKRVSYDQSACFYDDKEDDDSRRPSRRLSSIAARRGSRLSRRGSRKISIVVDEEEVVIKEWSEYTSAEKISFVFFTIIKAILFILFLYLFLLSLSFMTIGFTMVTYIALGIGNVIRMLLKNPFAALSIGIIATAIMQNATATTSIAVSMVGAGIISEPKLAIPIIMGSNIGTCVTNSFIALTMAGNPTEFKRAFSAATLNDGFNLLTTLILLPIEIIFGMLDAASLGLTNAILGGHSIDADSINFIGVIIDPVTSLFIKLDEEAVNRLAAGDKTVTKTALRCCSSYSNLTAVMNETLISTIAEWPSFNTSQQGLVSLNGVTVNNITFDSNYYLSNGTLSYNEIVCTAECKYWCMPMLRAFGDGGTGLFWILFSLIVLIASLFSIVKVSSLIIVGPIAKHLSRALNFSFSGRIKWLTEVILFLVAFLLTLIVQSSNIITATLVPLCGVGMITVQRVYVMTLGSNIGTTITGILSAFTSPPATLKKSLQLAMVYTFFNTLGVLFWLPIPKLRIPKRYARKLGTIVIEFRWFLYIYLGSIYFIGPLILLGLALIPNWIGLAVVGIPIILIAIILLVIFLLRKIFPKILPDRLKDFNWLPLWMRSLKPYDSKFKQIKCCQAKHKTELYLERRFSPVGDIEETIVEREVEEPDFLPSVIRRLSTINGLVLEARRLSRRSTAVSDSSSSSEDQIDVEKIEQRKREYAEQQQKKKMEKAKNKGRSFSVHFKGPSMAFDEEAGNVDVNKQTGKNLKHLESIEETGDVEAERQNQPNLKHLDPIEEIETEEYKF